MGKKEYIQRDALLEIAEQKVGDPFGVPMILRAIREAPAVDVVQVVRCEDCKHYANGFCDREISGLFSFRKPIDFCSYGESRKAVESKWLIVRQQKN